jgi:adenylate cyclase
MSLRDTVQNPTLRGATLGFVTALVCIWLNQHPTIRQLENWALDSCFVVRQTPKVPPGTADIVIVAIDEKSLSEHPEPLVEWSPKFARVARHVLEGGAKAVGIDVLYHHDVRAPASRQANEPALEDVLIDYPQIVAPSWILPDRELHSAWAMRSPAPWYFEGDVNLTPDADRFVRAQMLRMTGQATRPSFALAVHGAAHNLSPEWFEQSTLTALDGTSVPLDRDERLTINYRGPAGTIPTYSFADVHSAASGKTTNKELPNWKDKIVLIGVTAESQGDRRATPFISQSLGSLTGFFSSQTPELMPGVEVHANTIATLEDEAFITTPWWLSTPLLLIVAGVGLGIGLVRSRLETGLLVTFAHHWLWKGLCIALFCWASWRVEFVAMLFLGAMLFAVVFTMRWRWIRRTLGMIKSEAIASALEADPAKLNLRGEQRVITVLFSDIRAFTTYSESHTPRETVTLLNEYFSVVVPLLEQHGGTVNQYVGDGLMVIFGAPRSSPDHARSAVRAAVAMVSAVHARQEHWEQLGAPRFRIGVGIHTGPAIVGTVGSPNRLDYSAIGDTVNTGARIESANKELGTEILISAQTLAQCAPAGEAFEQLIGPPRDLTVKGKVEPLVVHEVSLVESTANRAEAVLSRRKSARRVPAAQEVHP